MFKKNRNCPIQIGLSSDKRSVYIDMDLQTDTCNPHRTFWFTCENQEEAYLTEERLQEVFDRFKTEIAKECLCYLDTKYWGELKKILSCWDVKKTQWNNFPKDGIIIK